MPMQAMAGVPRCMLSRFDVWMRARRAIGVNVSGSPHSMFHGRPFVIRQEAETPFHTAQHKAIMSSFSLASRTKVGRALKTCQVILIIPPAGQWPNNANHPPRSIPDERP